MSDEIKNRTIYMLCRKDKTEDDGTGLYIGSTTRPLGEWLRKHKKRAREFKMLGYSGDNKLFTRLNDVGLMNWKMMPLLTFACDKKTIFEFEKQWIGLIGPGLNTILAITDRKEYKAVYPKVNKEAVGRRGVNYYKENKQVILQKQAGYRKFNVQNMIHHCDVCEKSFGYR